MQEAKRSPLPHAQLINCVDLTGLHEAGPPDQGAAGTACTVVPCLRTRYPPDKPQLVL